MPKLNLRDEGFEEESNPLDSDQSVAPPPTLREVGVSGGGGKSSTLLTALLLLVVVAGGVFALNYFKVIHLWGKRTARITNEAISDQLPPPEMPAAAASTDQGANPAPAGESTPTPEPNVEPSATAAPPTAVPSAAAPAPSRPTRSAEQVPKFVPPPSGSGNYTVQVSSWTSKDAADREASRLTAAGLSAFVEDAVIAGENWYRVRVGHYASSKDAKDAADQLARSMEGQIWVAKVSAR